MTVLSMINGQVTEIQLPNIDVNMILDRIADIQNTIERVALQGESIASAEIILLTAGVVILLGVAGEAFFKKTGIPDIVFLMAFGVLIGPIFGIIGPEAVIQIVPYFAALALIIIMFDGGLNLDIKHVFKMAHFSATLAIFGFILSVGIVAIAAMYALSWPVLDSILLGSIVGGSSSVIVFGLVRNVKIHGIYKVHA